MNYARLPGTNFEVSRLSLGASALGGVFGTVDEAVAIRAVQAALDAGIIHFDVAPAYGGGRAEAVLGKALRGIARDRYRLSTKVGKYTDPTVYGRDTYASQLSRPAGATANNLYNLADFMLGFRSQYALSNVLVADLRKDMHFTYLQDDIRVNDALTVNLGLRYEYATPFWEKNNVLSNFDPASRTMVAAKDGSLYDRALVDPDKNNFAPRLGFAYSVMPKTVRMAAPAMAKTASTMKAMMLARIETWRRCSRQPYSLRKATCSWHRTTPASILRRAPDCAGSCRRCAGFPAASSR